MEFFSLFSSVAGKRSFAILKFTLCGGCQIHSHHTHYLLLLARREINRQLLRGKSVFLDKSYRLIARALAPVKVFFFFLENKNLEFCALALN